MAMIKLLLLPFLLAGSQQPSVAVSTPAPPAARLSPAPAAGTRAFTWLSICPQGLRCCQDTTDPCCNPNPPYCDPRVVSSCSFVGKNSNLVCVYQCAYQQTCYDCNGNPTTTPDPTGNRYRLHGYEYTDCPPADCSLCSG
jgi:hypothetical protein